MNVFEPTLEMINIEDIAHGLSNQCRFAGQLPKFYSVGQHSVMCSMYDEFPTIKVKLQALLHDAPEAYLMDIPTPIKRHLNNYKELENNVMKVIAEKFNIDYPFDGYVKWVDKDMLEWEWEYLMLQKQTSIKNFHCWDPTYAKTRFLEQYNKLTKRNLQSQ